MFSGNQKRLILSLIGTISDRHVPYHCLQLCRRQWFPSHAT